MSEAFEVSKADFQATEDFKDVLNNPVVKILLSYVVFPLCAPIQGAKDVADDIVEQKLIKKRNKLLECIVTEKVTSDKVKDINFLSEFSMLYNTLKSVQSYDKSELMAKLFKNAISDEESPKYDEYEEFLSKLNELSYREIQIIEMLSIKRTVPTWLEETNAGEKKLIVWQKFLAEVSEKLQITQEDVEAITAGVSRTGFCIPTIQFERGIPYTVYETTDYFNRLKKYIFE